MKYILFLCILFATSCITSKNFKTVQRINPERVRCFSSPATFNRVKAYHYRRGNPTMKHKF